MSKHTHRGFDTHDADDTPARPGELSANGQWLFGSLFAALTLIGFAFGVWAGAAKPKPTEVVQVKPKEEPEKLQPQPPQTQPAIQPQPQPEPKVKEPEPKLKEPEPKPKELEPKPKEPAPITKPKEPEPKKTEIKAVAFKEVRPLLMSYCGNCHGLSKGKPKAGIDLRTVAAIMKGGENGDIVKAGDPKKSTLYTSITDGTMPPDGKPAPNPKELQLIHDWILSGAKERRRSIRVKTRRRNLVGQAAGLS